MDEHDWLAERFEENRTHLRAVAYRMLGSLSEADDAVQASWLRLSRSDTSGVENLGGWLTTVVARVCLDLLRSRRSRREEPLEAHVPDPIVCRADGTDPEHQAILWPTRLDSRCSWSSKRWLQPSGSRSCCTTCSPCPSTRRSDRGALAGAHLRAALPVRTTGARERSRGSRRRPSWTAILGHGLHRQGWQDRRNRRARRPERLRELDLAVHDD
jgi:Sigma-70 region 2